jgi:hypothetical protein
MGKKREPSEREQVWLSHLRACAGGELKAYAEAHGLSVESLYQARHRLRRRGLLSSGAGSAAKPRFARVERAADGDRALVRGTAPPTPVPCRVHLRNGTVVELACAPEHWPGLLQSLAALP